MGMQGNEGRWVRLLDRFDDPLRRSLRREFATDGRRFYFTVAHEESDLWTMELLKRSGPAGSAGNRTIDQVRSGAGHPPAAASGRATRSGIFKGLGKSASHNACLPSSNAVFRKGKEANYFMDSSA